jgi:hypothetical protein
MATGAVGRLAAAAIVVGLALTGCGDAARDPAVSEPGTRILDETTAEFGGIRLGSTSEEIRRRFGSPLKSPDGAVTPPGVDYYEVGGPTSFQPPPALRTRRRGGGSVRYRDTAWLVERAHSYGVMTVAADARTRAGVRIGDAAERVTDRYPGAHCETANEGTEYATFPLCEAQPRPGVHLYFGGDPIKSIWLIITGDAAYGALRGGER